MTIAATSAGHQPSLRRVPVVALQPDIGGLARFFLPRLDVIGDPFLDLVQGHCVGRVESSSATAGHNFESLSAALSKLEAQALERARNPVLLSAHRRFLISCLRELSFKRTTRGRILICKNRSGALPLDDALLVELVLM